MRAVVVIVVHLDMPAKAVTFTSQCRIFFSAAKDR